MNFSNLCWKTNEKKFSISRVERKFEAIDEEMSDIVFCERIFSEKAGAEKDRKS